MEETSPFTYSKNVFRIPVLVVFLMWLVYWIEIKFSLNFTRFGVLPRTLSGLKGILCSPFIHSDAKHLFNNSIPIFVFIAMLFYFYKEIAFKLLILGTLLTGVSTWLIGGKGYHIGMSGVVYLLFSFIFGFSDFSKKVFSDFRIFRKSSFGFSVFVFKSFGFILKRQVGGNGKSCRTSHWQLG